MLYGFAVRQIHCLQFPFQADMAESVDAPDLKSVGGRPPWGFESPCRHQVIHSCLHEIAVHGLADQQYGCRSLNQSWLCRLFRS